MTYRTNNRIVGRAKTTGVELLPNGVLLIQGVDAGGATRTVAISTTLEQRLKLIDQCVAVKEVA